MNVIIIGAGVIGSAIAYYLSRKGIGATVIERCDTACAASGKSGGFLARDWCVGQPQDPLAQLSFDLHTDLADALETDYGYRRVDAYAMALSDRRSFSRSTGLSTTVNWLNNEGIVHQLLGDTTTTAQLHPEQFTRALLAAACTAGAQLRPGTVESVERDSVKNQVTGVTVDGTFLSADAVVIAMGPWSHLATQWLSLPATYELKGYSITLSPATPVTADALFLDYEDQFGERHGPELIPRADGRFICVGFRVMIPCLCHRKTFQLTIQPAIDCGYLPAVSLRCWRKRPSFSVRPAIDRFAKMQCPSSEKFKALGMLTLPQAITVGEC